jgi:hypothetical protein
MVLAGKAISIAHLALALGAREGLPGLSFSSP